MEGIHSSLRSVGTYNNENEENKNKIIIPSNIILSQSRSVQVSDTRVLSSAYISMGIFTSIVCAYTQEGPLTFRKNNIYFFESLFTVSFYQLFFFFFCSRPTKSPLQTSVNTWQTTGVTRARI